MTSKQREILRRAFDEAIARCQAGSVLAGYLPPVPSAGELIILAAGKAAGGMAEAAERHYAGEIAAGRVRGLVVVPHQVVAQLHWLELVHGSHPVPDEHSERAARQMLQTVNGLAAEDLVVFLVSGGTSALLSAPADGITLDEKRAVTQDLLACGASIDEINTVRTCLSDIKGGKLARACWPASVITLAVSDVVGDHPAVIGSGPTVDVSIDLDQARTVAEKYGLSLPENAGANDDRAAGPFPETRYEIIVRPMDALLAAAAVAEEHGYEAVILGDAFTGEAREVAAEIAAESCKADYEGKKIALLSGGEVTVTVDPAAVEPYGGSNRELALALAQELPATPGIVALIADTDGVDGQTGRDGPVAGAFVDSGTVRRGEAMGLDIHEYLAQHRSGAYFAELDDQFITGPTNTNVNDFRMLLIN